MNCCECITRIAVELSLLYILITSRTSTSNADCGPSLCFQRSEEICRLPYPAVFDAECNDYLKHLVGIVPESRRQGARRGRRYHGGAPIRRRGCKGLGHVTDDRVEKYANQPHEPMAKRGVGHAPRLLNDAQHVRPEKVWRQTGGSDPIFRARSDDFVHNFHRLQRDALRLDQRIELASELRPCNAAREDVLMREV